MRLSIVVVRRVWQQFSRAKLNPSVYSLVPPCVADVTVDCALCRNQINEHYYYY